MKNLALALLCAIALATPSFAQTGAIAPPLYPVFVNTDGKTPVANGFLCTTASGTSDAQYTYQDDTISTPNQDPVRLNSAGRAVNGSSLVALYLNPATPIYRFTLYAAGSSNSCNGSPVGALILQQDGIYNLGQLLLISNNTWTGTNTFTGTTYVKDLNNILLCDQFAGANMGAKLQACITALASTGGIADARGFQGAQVSNVNYMDSVSKCVEILFGAVTITQSTEVKVVNECFSMVGAGTQETTINYTGASNKSAFNIYGAFPRIQDLTIKNGNSGVWVAGVSYNGNLSIARSTHGRIQNVQLDCGGSAGPPASGDGISLGLDGDQADMLDIDHPYISRCYNGVSTHNGNVLSINLYAGTFAQNHIGVNVGVTTNFHVNGGEYDSNDINFTGQGGYPVTISGSVRSENSKRTWFSNSGSYQQPVLLSNYTSASINTTRPATTCAIVATSTSMTLSVAGYVSGDQIVCAGAGVASADLHTTITSMASLTSVTVANAASTTVTTGALSIDGGVEQHDLFFQGGGPYRVEECYFGASTGATAAGSNGPITFIGNTWIENTRSPFGDTYVNFSAENVTSIDNVYNTTTRMTNLVRTSTPGTITANATTFDIWGLGNVFFTANSAPTSIATFSSGVAGQVLYIAINDVNTSFVDSGNLHIGTVSPLAADNGRVYSFVNIFGGWYLQ